MALMRVDALEPPGFHQHQNTPDATEPSAPADAPPDQAPEQAPAPAPIPDVSLSPAIPGHSYREPIQVLAMPGRDDVLIIVERGGRVLAAPLGHKAEDVVLLDIRSAVTTRHSEEGLLSLAFDPNWPATPHVYAYWSEARPRRTVLSRFKATEDLSRIDRDSEERLLEIPQPYGNHNGGTVLFGPDGMLYLSVGDGGSANDPHGHGQDRSTLLGTVLRINVRGGAPYTIPPDNPFVDRDDTRDEIWALGLRNIWRMHFDPKTGELWGGDVGQNAWEEVDLIEKGGNYGWNVREGRHAFRRAGESSETFIEPVAEYGRDKGGSITGGTVYRGTQQPALDGVYFFGDYMSGRLWGLRRDSDGTVRMREVLRGRLMPMSSFGTGPDGEIYMAAFSAPYARRGTIMRLKATGSGPSR